MLIQGKMCIVYVELLAGEKTKWPSMPMACTLRNLTTGFHHTALDDNMIGEQPTDKEWKIVGIAYLTTVSTPA